MTGRYKLGAVAADDPIVFDLPTNDEVVAAEVERLRQKQDTGQLTPADADRLAALTRPQEYQQ